MKDSAITKPSVQLDKLRIVLLSVVLTALSSPLFAGGKAEEYPFEPVSGNSHWSYTVNLDDLEEGKHNLVIRAVDEAGNIRYEGPYDFTVDPETDIPMVSVAHPKPGDRVGRMLPIIGTSRDDDGISRVEVSIDDGPWKPASGAEAWSAVVDAGVLGDGPHTLAVKSYDLNGLESPVVNVPFVVDTSAPVGGVTDPVSGAMISGKTTFSGSIEDPNGVEFLEISKDGGESWEKLRFSKDKETGTASFEVSLDSRKMEDGPVVWWFRGIDSQGISSEVPFLFFVDNQGPDVSLELPVSGDDGIEAVPGNVFLAGRVSDLSGIRSLQILKGKDEPIEVPLTPGNPWWTWPLNLSGLKDKQVDIIIRAVDGAGSISEEKVRIPLDREADMPRISVDDVENLSEVVFDEGKAFLTGVFEDDDGAGAIEWKAGENEGQLEAVERAWRLDLSDLPPGAVKIEITPVDRFGLAGEPLELSFRIAPKPPLIVLENLLDNAADAPVSWTPGAVLSFSGGSIRGRVISDGGKGVSLSYIPAGGEETSISLKTDAENPGEFLFNIPIKKGGEPGAHNFILRAADGFGGETVLGSGFYMQAPPDENGHIPDPRIGDEAVNLPLPFLREKDGAAILRPGQPLQGWTSGASASGAKLVPESPFLRLRTSGTSFTIENLAPGLSEPVKVVLSDGSSSRGVVILTDFEAPVWKIDAPSPGTWSAGTLEFSGTLNDKGGIASASWALEGRSSTPVDVSDEGIGRYSFNFEADFSGQPDGPKILVLKAEDKAGNISEFRFPFVLDTTAPVLVQNLPPADLPVGAKSTLVYDVPGDELLEEVSLTVDGTDRIFAEDASRYALNLNLAGYSELPETFSLRAVDRAGNVSEVVPRVLYDPVSDKPVTFIQTPVDNSVVRSEIDIAGLVVDDDEIAAVYWRLDGQDWKKLTGDASFRVPLPLDTLMDGEHLLEVYAEDAAGNMGDVDASRFQITRREADVVLTTPEVGKKTKDVTQISGSAEDANGISEVWISFDNGHSYFLADGSSDFTEPGEMLESENQDGEGDSVSSVEPSASDESAPSEEAAANDKDSANEPRPPVFPVIRDEPITWNYAMDTSLLDNGVHTLLVKVIDGGGDEALLAGLLEVDNSPPLLAVGNPEEGSTQVGSMILEGRVMDEGGLESFSITLERDGTVLFENHDLQDGVFHIPLDFSDMEAGEVLLRVEAVDSAGNRSAVSRSFTVEPGRRSVMGEISLPVEGGQEGPYFTLNGYVDNALESDTAYLLVDGVETEALELDKQGRFQRNFSPGELPEGPHSFQIDVVSASGDRSEGSIRNFSYRSEGSWVVIDGFPPGMAVGGSPLLSGRSGYYLEEPQSIGEGDAAEDEKKAAKEFQKILKENRPDRVEVSLDGGLSFAKAKGTEEWEFLIETSRMGEGDLPILVRSRFPDGWVYSRTLLRLDKTLPDLKLNESVADGEFNGELVLTGTASDDDKLDEVSVSVRPGSQTRYEVPSFIQGMYFDVSALGATWFDAGLGVTFFDDNVKLQVSVGYAPDQVNVDGEKEKARVSGTAIGAELLANVVYLPLGYFWGPKWDKLSVSLAVGANFTYFTNFGDNGGGMMSAVVAQIEIPKITFPDRKFITYIAPYLEGQLWFFSSDVNTTPYFTASIGLRMGLL